MADGVDELIDRYLLSSAQFEEKLRRVRPGQWTLPTPCSEWDVRALVNHMTRGNVNYVRLIDGATGAEFLRSRDADALGADPVAAYARSVQDCAAAFTAPGVMQRTVDYPLGRVTGRQALAVRTTDSTIHTWDLARAIGADETLDAGLVRWIDEHLDEIYAGLAETPVSAESTHRFFATPDGDPGSGASTQDRLLHRMGRTP
ncbi:TIGR03086 family metal-binding protein [Pseudonocardia adelaidensis]